MRQLHSKGITASIEKLNSKQPRAFLSAENLSPNYAVIDPDEKHTIDEQQERAR